MKLSHKLVLSLTAGIIASVSITGVLWVKREVTLIEDDARNNLSIMGHSLKPALVSTWRSAGRDQAFELLDFATERIRRRTRDVDIRWVSLDSPGAVASNLAASEIERIRRGEEIVKTDRGNREMTLYVPVTANGWPNGALELSQSLKLERTLITSMSAMTAMASPTTASRTSSTRSSRPGRRKNRARAVGRLRDRSRPWRMDRCRESGRAGQSIHRQPSDPGGDVPGRVLVVDDDQSMCEMLEAGLGRRGVSILWRTSAEDALNAIDTGRLDAAVTDLRLSGMDGVALCRQLVVVRPGLPVIIMTAFGSFEAAVAALRAGAYDVLAKPLDIDELSAILATAIDLTPTRPRDEPVRGLVGACGAMQRVGERLREAAGFLHRSSRLFEVIRGQATSASFAIASERATVVATRTELALHDLPQRIRDASGGPDVVRPTAPGPLHEVERQHIVNILREVHGNRALAARVLGIGRRTLYRKLEAYGLAARG